MADKKKRQYVGLRDLKDAEQLAARRIEAEAARNEHKRDWGLNRAYYAGNQWTTWNPTASRVETIDVDKGPKWRVRLQSNQIKPGLIHYVAQLTKTRPTIVAEPDSGANKDIKAAQMAESLYDYLWDTLKLNAKTQDVLIEAGLSGGFWSIHWDHLAGKSMQFVVSPETGEPIVDDELAEAYLEALAQELAAAGADPSMADQIAKKTVYLGDIAVEVMPAENVLLDPTASRFEDCKWAICTHTMDPDEIEARWGVKVEPDSAPEDFYPAPAGKREEPMGLTKRVYIMYVKPCPAMPDGRYVVWIEEPNKKLQDIKWPYPFDCLPLVQFPGIYQPNSVYDSPISSDARPDQDDINKGLSQITEWRNHTVKPQIIAPYGSMRTVNTGEPGALLEFNPIGNAAPPQWRDVPPLPQYVFGTIQDAMMRMDRLFSRTPTQRDQLPPRTDSGHLMQSMQEAVADQLSPVIIRLEDALALAGHIFAAYAQKYYEEPRLLKIRGAGGSVQVKKFQSADIAGGFSFRPSYGTGLPRTREGKRAAILELLEAQLIDPRSAMKHLDLADLKGVQSKMAQAEDFGYRTLDKMRRGQPINEQAIADVQAQIQQFQEQVPQIVEMLQSGEEVDMNGDGLPDNPQQVVAMLEQQWQELQVALQDAPWMPLVYEDKASSLEVTGEFLNSVEFEAYPPEMKEIFIRRFTLLLEAIQSEQQPDPANLPKVSLQMKATTSAKTASAILQSHGIDVDEHEVAELPLETEVYDSVDKPDEDEAGNDPFTEEEHAQTIQQAEDDHLTAQAKAAADMARARADEERKEESHQQQLRHAEESHMNQQQQQAESAAVKNEATKKQANKPAAKGK